MGPALGFEENSWAASEAGQDNVPTIDFLTRILRETEHVLESGHVEGNENARFENVLHCKVYGGLRTEEKRDRIG